MQPWENDNVRIKQPKKRRRSKLKIAADGITLGLVVCTAIYGCLIYEATKSVAKKCFK